MFSVSDRPKIDVARVTKTAREKLRAGRCGGGINIGGYMPGGGIGGGIMPGIIPGGIQTGGGGGGTFPLGGGGGVNAPRGSIGPCPGGGCGIIVRSYWY